VPEAVQHLFLSPNLKRSPIDGLARQHAIPLSYEAPSFFHALAPGGGHQGVAAHLQPFPYTPLSHILEKHANLLLILDGILDPRNLGALLRTAEGAGVGGVVLPHRRAAGLSAVVEKTAAGATAYLPICQVSNVARSLDRIQAAGYWLVGLAPEASQTLYDLGPQQDIALLLGGEEKGLRPVVRARCDCLAALPMRGEIGSLNVAAAGAIALYEILRRNMTP
jgi:23S rRNA (guanosine2251-2'-O)-methyltransferase